MDLFSLNHTFEDDPRVLEWIADHSDALGSVAAQWFRAIRTAGPDVNEVLHDGCPTACIGVYPFAYVGAYKAHVNLGFYYGAWLDDPGKLLEGSGKRMRHVKLKPGQLPADSDVEALVSNAYRDLKDRIDLGDH